MPGWPLPPDEPAIYPSTPGGVTAPTLEDYQFQFNGVTFGAATGVGLLQMTGMGGMPTVNSKDVPFPRDTGEYVGVDVMGGRDISADFWLATGILDEMLSVGSSFASTPINPQPLWFQLPGYEILCSMCRARKRPEKWDAVWSAQALLTMTVDWHANDPRLYGQGRTQGFLNSGEGLAAASVDQAGNWEVRPVLVLNGPLHAPTITNTSIGSEGNWPALVFVSGTEIAEGDQVVIDLSTPHTVNYWTGGIGGSPQYNIYDWLDPVLTSWWNLLPGENLLTAQVSSGDIADNQIEVWWSNAYML